MKQALALAKDPNHPDETFLGPEAIYAAKPVIGCRGQGIAEITRHGSNGFPVGPDNERELALALAM